MNQKVLDALNEQIKHEFYSSHVYLSVAAHCEIAGLPGFANWFRVQADEEHEHAMKIYDFVLDRGAQVRLQPIDAPPTDFGGPLQIAEKTLEHEQRVTGLIHSLYDLAVKEGDQPAQVMLQWFVTEQVEEEKNATLLVDQLRMVGDNRAALLMLDMEMGKRVGS
jgi:ferritin